MGLSKERRQKFKLQQQQRQRQPSFDPKILGSIMDPQQINQGQPSVFFSTILFYLKSYSLLSS